MEIINFQNKDIRTIDKDGETWYSVIDVIDVLTDSKNARAYWNTLKFRLRKAQMKCLQIVSSSNCLLLIIKCD